MKDDIAESVFKFLQAGLALKERLNRSTRLDLVEEQAVLTGLLNKVNDPVGEKVGSEGYLGIRYPLTCWIDEVIILYTPRSADWNERKLETRLFDTNARGYMFWQQAEKAKGRQGSSALEIFFLCVVLGFQGELRGRIEELEAWIRTTRMQINSMQALEAPAVPGRGAPPTNVPPLTGRRQFDQMLILVSLAVLLAIPVLAFFLVRHLLS